MLKTQKITCCHTTEWQICELELTSWFHWFHSTEWETQKRRTCLLIILLNGIYTQNSICWSKIELKIKTQKILTYCCLKNFGFMLLNNKNTKRNGKCAWKTWQHSTEWQNYMKWKYPAAWRTVRLFLNDRNIKEEHAAAKYTTTSISQK